MNRPGGVWHARVVTALPANDVVLLGIGHTNAHVLRMWRMEPLKGTRLTCVSNEGVTTYSGMLPGVLAGQYPPERMEIDLVRLTAAAGARLIIDEVTGLDPARQELLFDTRAPVRFDVLSIGIGSVPGWGGVQVADGGRVVTIKPMQTFLSRLEDRLRVAAAERGREAIRILVVGGGAGGVEITLCLPAYLRRVLGADVRFELQLVTADEQLLSGGLLRTTRRIERLLDARGVQTRTWSPVVQVSNRTVTLADGPALAADVILWATGAAAPPVLARLGLPTDARGFLLTDDSLRTTTGAPVFAVGDTGTIAAAATPKAGVYAVRQGPVLWTNIQQTLSGKPLRRYAPQQGFLKLLNTGDGRAIAEWRGATFEGAWCWRLKNFIDSRFIRMYQDYTRTSMAGDPERPSAAGQMRCAGCGGKVGSAVLARVLARLDVPPHENVMLGLGSPDDAAIVSLPGAGQAAVTVDFFTAPLDDPFVVGRIAALNAASDAFAIGATPWAALAIVTLPFGRPRQQEDLLFQLLSGSLAEFRAMGATIVGGHTIEGPTLTVGFTVIAAQNRPPRTKRGLEPGDQLVLTKPLGTGVLLAAHMQARCRAGWYVPLLSSMLTSNGAAVACVDAVAVSALTDVTGFGLAGHLLEMLRASDVSADLDLDHIPLLPGADRLFDEGLESTLAPSNRDAEADLTLLDPRQANDARCQALFDPQTSGGLLVGARRGDAGRLLSRLATAGFSRAAVIGRVERSQGRRRIHVR